MRIRDLEIENRHLRETLDGYNRQFKVVRSQEVTIKLLRERIRDLENREESTVQEKTEEKEPELADLFSERDVERPVEEADTKVAQLQSALDRTQSELFDLKSKYDEDSNANRSDEMEIIVNALERSNQRAALAEKEVHHLKDQLAAAKQSLQLADQIQKAPDMEQAVDVVARSSLELELAAKEKEISQLLDDIQRLQTILNTLKETSASKIAQLEELVNEKDKMIIELGEKLVRQQDYDDIKRELSVMKSTDGPTPRPWENMDSTKEKPPDLTPHRTIKAEDTACSQPYPGTDAPDTPAAPKEELCSRPGTPSGEGCKPPPSPPTAAVSPNAAAPPAPVAAAPSPPDASLGRLQDCLRHNIDKYASETLNTLNIARCVRELLSVHNIGQRLFAKFVLGLSQGTVSELLSKPKPWDKLTEKGRDSYRKMHAWASDDQCIGMLKSLVPRRVAERRPTHLLSSPPGKECVGGGNGGGGGIASYKPDDPGAEERIAQILNEAQMAMMKQQERKSPPAPLPNGAAADSRSLDGSGGEDGADHPSRQHNGNSNHSNPDKSFRRSRKYENDDIPQEMVARIYQELAKLIGQRVEEGFRTPRDQFERTQEEIRQALTIYHQELTRLSHLMPPNPLGPFANGSSYGAGAPLSNGGVHPPSQDCPVDATVASRVRSEASKEPELRHHGSAFSLVRPKTDATSTPPTSSSSMAKGPPTTTSAPSSTTYALPGTNASPAGGEAAKSPGAPEDLATSASPLQRMQSITNSLLSQSSLPSLPNPPQRPAKAVLPPITQQQFDQYNNVNTEDIVKKVKEQLSQYSISQRLFGESVLGLSQGSVSDLLARPKPWHMLTQKGREPFIRMKIFLEDENAVHKLVASQYKIAPEKLMRTGSFGGATNPQGIMSFGSTKLTPRPPEPPTARAPTEGRQLALSAPNNAVYSAPRTPESALVPVSGGGGGGGGGAPAVVSNPLHGRGKTPSTLVRGYNQPSVYEMAALTTDLDTQVITSKIKETLMAHNIGQKIFGEVVLGLSQGSVSELLSKPKPWHMLSIKGREPFIRMQMWLNDPHNVEMLQTIKNERREANKRRRTADGPPDSASSPRSHHSDGGPAYGGGGYGGGLLSLPPPSSPYPPAKKPRVLFTEEQKEALRLAFSLDPYPSTATIEFLASELALSVRTITNWFHNHRMRMKQHASPASSSSPDDEAQQQQQRKPPSEGGLAFDPVHYRMLLNQRLAERCREKGGGGGGGPPFVGAFGAYLYSPYRNCSPLSSSGDDVGTLDLSMSGPLRNATQYSGKTDTTGSSTDDRSNSEINDDSNLSQDALGQGDGSDRESADESRRTESPPRAPPSRGGPPDRSRIPTSGGGGGGSSNRRKPAMPQWVNPGLELSPDNSEDEDDLAEDEDDDEEEEIINGVCVRQTEDFDLLLPPRVETVHVLPTPAPDDKARGDAKSPPARRPPEAMLTNGDVARTTPPVEGVDEDESWDDAEAKDRRRNIEKLQQRLEKEDAAEDWEF